MSFQQGLGKRSEEVLLALRLAIAQGSYPVGGRLPGETQLGEQFGASRNTVRRAIARLAAEGLLEVRKGAGIFVQAQERPAVASRTIAAMFPFTSDSLMAVQHYALAHDYLLCVYAPRFADWNPAHERVFLERVRAERHQGLLALLTPAAPVNDDLIHAMRAEGVRIVHVEPYRMTPPDDGYILPDYRRAGYLAATTLMFAGYEELVFVGTEGDWPSARLFRQGFIEALNDHRGGYDPARHYFEFPTGADTNPAQQAALDAYLAGLRRPTGFVGRSSELISAILYGLRKLGRKVPGDFGGIGIRYLTTSFVVDDIDEITFDFTDWLQRAIDAIVDDTWAGLKETIPPQLQQRGTVRE